MNGEKTRLGLKLRKNVLSSSHIKKEREIEKQKFKKPKPKKKKIKTTRKKDEENILSKDIDMEEEIKELDRMNENRGFKTRDISNLAYAKSYMKNLKFKPQKYKGSYLPYHLRWIFNNTVKQNEIVLIQEIEALENEIERLKQLKLMNREFRKFADLPFGISSTACTCCKKNEKKKHECTHEFCDPNCSRKKADLTAQREGIMTCLNQTSLPTFLKKKLALGKTQIFGLVDRSKDPLLNKNLTSGLNITSQNNLGSSGDKNDKKPFFIIKK